MFLDMSLWNEKARTAELKGTSASSSPLLLSSLHVRALCISSSRWRRKSYLFYLTPTSLCGGASKGKGKKERSVVR